MKILFLFDFIYSGEATTIKIAKRLAKSLQDKGNSVHLLCNSASNQTKIAQDFPHTVFESYDDKILYDTINQARAKGKGILGQALSLIRKPKAMINAVMTVAFKKSLIEKVYQSQIEKLCAKQEFDVVVAVSCPFHSSFALGNSKISSKKICYMLDPYWSNKAMPYAVSIKREAKLYKQVDGCIITDLMFLENQATSLKQYENKMFVLPFAGIEKKPFYQSEIKFLQKDKINCAYVGNLYAGIRSPQYIFEALELLKNNIVFSFTGAGYEGFEKGFFESYLERLNGKLIINDAVSANIANDINQKADILINLGNTTDNQLPSKIFDYISTGKPVLNFYVTDACPSLTYFSQYPLALSVKQGDFSKETIEKIQLFCEENNGKRLEYDLISQIFKKQTIESVSQGFEEIAMKVIGD